MNTRYLNINRYLECTESEGPGKRFCIWSQGCIRRCPGCCNHQMLDIKPAMVLDVIAMAKLVTSANQKYLLEGITLLGGEPMIQAQGYVEVLRQVVNLSLSVVVFTGYTLEHLKTGEIPGALELLDLTDVLIDGPYLADEKDYIRNWVGSRNQRFHYFTDRYSDVIEKATEHQNMIELRMNSKSISVNGCPKAIENIIEET